MEYFSVQDRLEAFFDGRHPFDHAFHAYLRQQTGKALYTDPVPIEMAEVQPLWSECVDREKPRGSRAVVLRRRREMQRASLVHMACLFDRPDHLRMCLSRFPAPANLRYHVAACFAIRCANAGNLQILLAQAPELMDSVQQSLYDALPLAVVGTQCASQRYTEYRSAMVTLGKARAGRDEVRYDYPLQPSAFANLHRDRRVRPQTAYQNILRALLHCALEASEFTQREMSRLCVGAPRKCIASAAIDGSAEGAVEAGSQLLRYAMTAPLPPPIVDGDCPSLLGDKVRDRATLDLMEKASKGKRRLYEGTTRGLVATKRWLPEFVLDDVYERRTMGTRALKMINVLQAVQMALARDNYLLAADYATRSRAPVVGRDKPYKASPGIGVRAAQLVLESPRKVSPDEWVVCAMVLVREARDPASEASAEALRRLARALKRRSDAVEVWPGRLLGLYPKVQVWRALMLALGHRSKAYAVMLFGERRVRAEDLPDLPELVFEEKVQTAGEALESETSTNEMCLSDFIDE